MTQETPEELRLRIEQTRQELGETVDAISHKADVKERVKANPAPLATAVGAGIALLVLLRVLRRR
jgi:Protein of unknown function (DUF3618)